MITKQQVETLSKDFQIDTFTIIREYLQVLFLSYFYREKESGKIYFKGGTAIRLLFGSPRFSEDLDFSTTYDKKQIEQIVKKVESKMQKELPGLQISLLYSGKNGIRFKVRYQTLFLKYPLTIRLDFTKIKKIEEVVVSPLVTNFPATIFSLISHFSDKKILSEKIEALSTRNKGRDFFDVWFLLEKGVLFKKEGLDKKDLLNKITLYPQSKLNQDLAQFLPKSQRKITEMLKEKLENKIVEGFGSP